jgi:hypothetical protein
LRPTIITLMICKGRPENGNSNDGHETAQPGARRGRGLDRPGPGGNTTTLKFVPQSPLASLDPVWTSAMTTRNVGFQVFDVLFGRDAQMNPKPQMLEG